MSMKRQRLDRLAHGPGAVLVREVVSRLAGAVARGWPWPLCCLLGGDTLDQEVVR